MKTISDLNSKIWYRIIKVLYFLFFVSALLSVVGSIYEGDFDVRDIEKSKVICQRGNGKTFSLEEVFGKENIPSVLSSYYNIDNPDIFSQKILDYCQIKNIEIDQDDPRSRSRLFSGFKTDDYRFEEVSKRRWDYVALSFIGVILLFELLKRIFYYILLGRIRPQK